MDLFFCDELFLIFPFTLALCLTPFLVTWPSSKMADEVKIDKSAFQDRLLSFVSTWKADKRSGDALFGGVGSVVILMGRNEEVPTFQKKNAMHVSLP